MKNKKLATAMAAAMTLGAVAPMATTVFADGNNETTVHETEVRKSEGYKLITEGKDTAETVKIHTRTQAFNTNGTTDTKDDTLKIEGTRVVSTFDVGNDKKVENDIYVLEQSIEKSEDKANAKAELELYISEIKSLLAERYTTTDGTSLNGKTKYKAVVTNATKADLAITEVEEAEGILAGYKGPKTDNKTVVKIHLVDDQGAIAENAKFTYNFNGIYTEGENGSIETKKESVDLNHAKDYTKLNKIKYALELNASEIKVVKTEDNTIPGKLLVKVYAKDADLKDKTTKAYLELTIENTLDFDKNPNKGLLVNMPATTNVDGTWSEKEVKEAMLNGWFDAVEDFRPTDSITRAEFAKVACKVFGITYNKNMVEPFTDVAQGEWFYKDVVALYNRGAKGNVISGIEQEDGTFKFDPTAQITRESASKMVAALMNKENEYAPVDTKDSKGKETDVKTAFADDADIAAWADEAVLALSDAKVLKGIEEDGKMNFKPANQISRQEVAVMMHRAVAVK